MEETKGYFDQFVGKIISRKFLVWLVATVLMFVTAFTKFTVLSSNDWVIISAMYIGSQTIVDAVAANKNSTLTNVLKTFTSDKKEEPKKVDKKEEVETKRPEIFGGQK